MIIMVIQMNLFKIVFLDVILLTFPLLLFLIYLATNKNINNKSKRVYFKLTLFSSFFLIYNYGIDSPITVPVLALNSIIILCYLEDNYILANIFSIAIILMYKNVFNNILFLLIVYVLVAMLYILKK